MITRYLAILFVSTILVSTTSPCWANDPLIGSWHGKIAAGQQTIELVFHINKNSQGYHATLDVPAQQQFALPMSSVTFRSGQITLALTAANINYQGKVQADQIQGRYQQGSFTTPLILTRSDTVITRKAKPQEPTRFEQYSNRQVRFHNRKDNIELSGILTLPKAKIEAAVVVLSGSGPTSQDGDIAGHKLFLVWADMLAKQGIAVLRFDDRGVAQSTGDFATATSADFANDAHAAIEFLTAQNELNGVKIGYLGHSEGGLIAAIAQAKYKSADFIVSLAGTGTSGAQVLIEQSYHIQQLMGISSAELNQSDQALRQIMAAIKAGHKQPQLIELMLSQGDELQVAQSKAKTYLSPWFYYFINTSSQTFLNQIAVPVLALNGSLDSQVLPQSNIKGFQQALSPTLLTSKVYKNLNHLFQPATTGLPTEYSQIETTIAPIVMKDIGSWLKQL